MHTPPYLTAGATIGITCPAGYVAHDRISYAVRLLENWGFNVVIGETIGKGDHYFAGTDAERLQDLQNMLDDDRIDAIMMGRGGYGTSRIIDSIDFTRFEQKPKWICGFSDITVLHSHIHATLGIATLHSPMCGAFSQETENEDHIQCVLAALTGKELRYNMQCSKFNKKGSAEAPVIGGNLAILAHLTGSQSAVTTDGKILLIEDVGEHLYNIDRLMLNLKRSGQLANLAALLVGSFTDIQDTSRPFGKDLQQLITDNLKDYDYPICFNFPCGHQDVNFPVRLGQNHLLNVGDTTSTLVSL